MKKQAVSCSPMENMEKPVDVGFASSVKEDITTSTLNITTGLMGVRRRVPFIARHKEPAVDSQSSLIDPLILIRSEEEEEEEEEEGMLQETTETRMRTLKRTRENEKIKEQKRNRTTMAAVGVAAPLKGVCLEQHQLVETSVSLNQMQQQVGKIASRSGYGQPGSTSGHFGPMVYGQSTTLYTGYPSTSTSYSYTGIPTIQRPLIQQQNNYPRLRIGDPYYTFVVQYAKGMVSYLSCTKPNFNYREGINSMNSRFSTHGLNGNNIIYIPPGPTPPPVTPWDDTFSAEPKLIFQLVDNWGNMNPNPYLRSDSLRFENHSKQFWGNVYGKHSFEVQMDQITYFTKGLNFFRRVDDGIHAAKDRINCTYLNGGKMLDPVLFHHHVFNHIGPVGIRVSQKTKDSNGTRIQPVQEIRELKFYLNFNENFCYPPPNVLNGQSDYATTHAINGTSYCDPAYGLFVTE